VAKRREAIEKVEGPDPRGLEHPKFPLPCSKFPVLTLVTIKLTAATRVEEGCWVILGWLRVVSQLGTSGFKFCQTV